MNPCKHNNHGHCLWCEAERLSEEDNRKFDSNFLKFVEKLIFYAPIPKKEDPNKLADAMAELQFKNGKITRKQLDDYKIKRDIEDLEKLANGKG